MKVGSMNEVHKNWGQAERRLISIAEKLETPPACPQFPSSPRFIRSAI